MLKKAVKSQEIPLVSEMLKICQYTLDGLPLWKAIGIDLTLENLGESVYLLRTDLAAHFGVRHDNFKRNLCKLQKKGHLGPVKK